MVRGYAPQPQKRPLLVILSLRRRQAIEFRKGFWPLVLHVLPYWN
jgi:hypothetical protein